ncbi:MAG: lytic murein transglycosylase [Magnetospirillum sp. WYHS-4]
MRLSKLCCAVAALLLAGCSTPLPVQAQGENGVSTPAPRGLASQPSQPFASWLEGLKADAARRGVSAGVFDKALGRAQPIERIVELDRKQPEFTQTFWGYMDKRITGERIEKGRRLLDQHKGLLDRVAKEYGVQPRFLVAFWGLETNFGETLGGFSTAEALATLAWDPRRSAFFREQLLTLLVLMQKGDVPTDARGSWAGAMGHFQFMPATYRDFAVDFDGDRRRDLWKSFADAAASAANYLSRSGWRGDQTWGREVLLPAGFDWELADGTTRRGLAEWRNLGLRAADGSELPARDIDAALVLPTGHKGPAFLAYGNFNAIMTWNRSVLYAVSVGHLADRMAGGAPLKASRAVADVPLSRQDVLELQQRLIGLGMDIGGEPDGVVGVKTRQALKTWQKRNGLPPDGYPDGALLERLRRGG